MERIKRQFRFMRRLGLDFIRLGPAHGCAVQAGALKRNWAAQDQKMARGSLSFGYFSLAVQRKVTRRQRRKTKYKVKPYASSVGRRQSQSAKSVMHFHAEREKREQKRRFKSALCNYIQSVMLLTFYRFSVRQIGNRAFINFSGQTD